jgi:hypothetical protein
VSLMTPEAAWQWRPSKEPWAKRLKKPLTSWDPDPQLELNAEGISAAFSGAIVANAAWTWHPSVSRLLDPTQHEDAQRDLLFAAWVAANCDTHLGTVTIQPRSSLRDPRAEPLSPGTYDLAQIGRQLTGYGHHGPAVDATSGSLGYTAFSTDWQTRKRLILGAASALWWAGEQFPDILNWISDVTIAILPIPPLPGSTQSKSNVDAPGAVWMNANDRVSIVELLVHESAHHYLYLAEAAAPLLKPCPDDRFPSPLRTDLRPLRGVLLAVHAIAYMGLYYQGLRESPALDGGLYSAQVSRWSDGFHRGLQTLSENQRLLTQAGQDFLIQTEAVAASWHSA